MPAQIRCDGGQGRGTVLGDEAIGVILDDRHAVMAGDRTDRRAAPFGNRDRRRILQGRIDIKQLRSVQFDRFLKSLRRHAICVHRKADELEAKLCGDGAHAGIGDAFR